MLIEKQTFIQDKYVLNLLGFKLPLEAISGFVKVLIFWFVAFYAFNTGQQIAGDNLKLALYLHDKSCEPRAANGGVEWVCLNNATFNFTTGENTQTPTIENLSMPGVIVSHNQSPKQLMYQPPGGGAAYPAK